MADKILYRSLDDPWAEKVIAKAHRRIPLSICKKNKKVEEEYEYREKLLMETISRGLWPTLEEEILMWAEMQCGENKTPELKKAIDEYINDKPRTILPPEFSKRR